jgi:iron complex transport system ATP-binding protein
MIKIQQLTAGYSGKDVFRGFSLQLEKGATYFLLGRNGSGKSTFLKALCAEIHYQGTIEINGFNLKTISAKKRAGIIANLPQQIQSQFDITVLDLVIAGKFHQKKLLEGYSKADEAEAMVAIVELGFATPGQSIIQLSGGEQQMVWLAQVAMQNTPVVVLDEPTQHLDLYYKKQVFNQLANWSISGKTLIVSTHDTQYLSQFPEAKLLFFQKQKAPMVLTNTPENLSFVVESIQSGN